MNGPLTKNVYAWISWSDQLLVLCTNLLSVESNECNVVDSE